MSKIDADMDFDDFDDFEEFISGATDYRWDCPTVIGVNLPCYLSHLNGTEYVDSEDIPIILEAALRYDVSDDGLLFVSVTSHESNHKDWLEAIQDYPGVLIREVKRMNGPIPYTCYMCFVPATPDLENI